MSNMRWLAQEFDYVGNNNNNTDGELFLCEILSQPKNEVAFGSAIDAARCLSGLERQIYESSDWVSHQNILLKKLDAVEQALDGDYGHDWTDGDLPEVIEKLKAHPEAIRWLEENGMRVMYTMNEEDAICHSEFGDITITDQNGADSDANEQLTEEFDVSELNINEVNFGYNQPRDKYRVSERKWRVNFKEAAARRERYYREMMNELHNLVASNPFVKTDTVSLPQSIEQFMDRIRDAYKEDVALRNEWNDVEKETYRSLYSQFLRNQNLDEETIREKLWHAFDKERRQTWDIYRDGKFYKTFMNKPSDEKLAEYNSMALPGKFTKPSFWNKCKSNAYMNLNLTNTQWKKVYEFAWEKLVDAIKLMARNADTADMRYEVRRLVNKYERKLGGRKEAQQILKTMPRTIRKG